jgi:hypothetical protein
MFATTESLETQKECPAHSVPEELVVPLASGLARLIAAGASVDDEDLSVLRALARRFPHRLTQARIAAETNAPRVCRRTVAKRVPQLLREGLVALPRGKKGGYVITDAGRALLARAARP